MLEWISKAQIIKLPSSSSTALTVLIDLGKFMSSIFISSHKQLRATRKIPQAGESSEAMVCHLRGPGGNRNTIYVV